MIFHGAYEARPTLGPNGGDAPCLHGSRHSNPIYREWLEPSSLEFPGFLFKR